MSELPTEDEFRGCIGDEFAVIDGENGTTVVLDEVTSLGDLDVFLVPIQPDARGSLYEAVFG